MSNELTFIRVFDDEKYKHISLPELELMEFIRASLEGSIFMEEDTFTMDEVTEQVTIDFIESEKFEEEVPIDHPYDATLSEDVIDLISKVLAEYTMALRIVHDQTDLDYAVLRSGSIQLFPVADVYMSSPILSNLICQIVAKYGDTHTAFTVSDIAADLRVCCGLPKDTGDVHMPVSHGTMEHIEYVLGSLQPNKPLRGFKYINCEVLGKYKGYLIHHPDTGYSWAMPDQS